MRKEKRRNHHGFVNTRVCLKAFLWDKIYANDEYNASVKKYEKSRNISR